MTLDALVRSEHGRMISILARATGGDLELAEDALQQALLVALEQWPERGWPDQPVGWLVRTARNKAIDRMRRNSTFARKRHLLEEDELVLPPDLPDDQLPDERLRLIFTCCHPALNLQARVALTMRSVCGLATDEIARAFLIPPTTLAQRLVRAQRKIRSAGIPYKVPETQDLEERLEGVMQVVYLVFTEGYGASGGEDVVRADLCDEAIRLGRWLVRTIPADGEVHGLLALMLLQDSRRAARASEDGELVLLEDQDRSLWSPESINLGGLALQGAFRRGPPGPFTLQAAIAAVHAQAARYEDTDWQQIVGLYGLLMRAMPSPVVALNRAAAVAMAQGPLAGLVLLDELDASGALERYHLLASARAELLRRLGRLDEADVAYVRALEDCTNPRERRFLERRRAQLLG